MSFEFFSDIPAQNFLERLRHRRLLSAADNTDSPPAPDVQQWLQYWNDEESLAGNLRNVEHWLQRARLKT